LKPGETGLISGVFRIDQIPDNLKDIAALQLGARLADVREQGLEGQTDAQKKLSEETSKEAASHVKSLLRDGGSLTLKLDVDHKAQEVRAEFSVDGKPGSKLATNIAELGQVKSLFAGLIGKDSAMNLQVTYALPARLRKSLSPVVDEFIHKASQKAGDDTHKALVEKVLKALEPSLKAGEIDAAVDLRGPSAKSYYTLIAAIKIKDGAALEQTLKGVIKDLPEEHRKMIKMDAQKAGDISINQVDVQHVLDEKARGLFGTGPVYFAVRSNALFVSLGEHALSTLKESLAAQPGTGQLFHMELAMTRLAKLIANDQPAAPKAAETAFGKNRDADKIRISFEGGQSLKAQVSIQPMVIRFFSLLEEAKKDSAR
jgi:hypothetical protein